MNKDIFAKTIQCLYCQKKFKTMKVKVRSIRVLERETDFRPIYKDENPYHYTVNVCPHCNMAFTESFGSIKERYIPDLETKYLNKMGGLDLCGVRTVHEGIKSFQLALLCADLIHEKDLIKANLCLAIAWLYRSKGNYQKDLLFQEKALKGFINVYERDSAPSEEMQKVMYLVGELYARQKNYDESARWFNILFSQPVIEPAIENIARERWQDIREEYTQQKEEKKEDK